MILTSSDSNRKQILTEHRRTDYWHVRMISRIRQPIGASHEATVQRAILTLCEARSPRKVEDDLEDQKRKRDLQGQRRPWKKKCSQAAARIRNVSRRETVGRSNTR